MCIFKKLIGFFLCLVFFSCQKEHSDDPSNSGTLPCKIVKTYLYDFGQLSDSVIYTHTNEKITKVTLGNEYHISLTYDGNKIIRRDYFDLNTNTADGYGLVSYNSDGTINKIEEYQIYNGQMIADWQYKFSYTAGKLSKLDVLDDQSQPFEEYLFTYSGNNISSTELIDDPNGSNMHYITEWQYDNLKNAYDSNQQALLIDGLIMRDMGGYAAFCLSANNVKEIGVDNDFESMVYIRDAKNNITETNVAGSLFSKNIFDCK